MTLPAEGTLLTISVMGITLYSARGLTQILAPIQASVNMHRTVNGVLVNTAHRQFQRYATKITCTDQRVPAIDGVWPGMRVTIGCVCELSYPTSGGVPSRSVVADSSREEGDFTFYRPVMDFLITPGQTQFEEWAANVQWELTGEEVGDT